MIFVQNNLTIDSSTAGEQIIQVAEGGFLAFIVGGDITVTGNVGYDAPDPVRDIVFADPFAGAAPNIEGVFIADGNLTIDTLGTTVHDNKFIGAGTFVGWSGVLLNRNYAEAGGLYRTYNNKNPVSVFIYRPDLLVNFPEKMKEAQYEWQEVAPEALSP